MGDLSKYLNKSEIACKCGCGLSNLSPKTTAMFDLIREHVGKPLAINSGCRCKEYNTKVGGEDNSAHMPYSDGHTYALDVAIPDSQTRWKFLEKAFNLGIKRIGVYKTFIHFDMRQDLPQCVVWYA